MTTIEIRETQEHEIRHASNVMRLALLHGPATDAEWEKWGVGWREETRSFTAWDGDRCVGNASSFVFDTYVPGGAWLPTSGVTRVGVIPTHTRRGLLSGMMRGLLTADRADGRVIAALRASEAVIYGRYGFGLAGEACDVTVHTGRMRPIRGAGIGGSFRMVTAAEVLDVVPPIYERAMHRPGAITRSTLMWKRYLDDVLTGDKPHHVVVHTGEDGVDDGYVHYSVEWEPEDTKGERLGVGTLSDLFGATPEVELALWDFLAGVSLIKRFTAFDRPVDDLVRHALTDVRAYQVTDRWDEQWIRLLDVEACLRARTYEGASEVTIAVTDPWFADNEGTFRITPSGAARTTDAPELVAPIDAVSAAYFGSVPWRDLLAAGRVQGTHDAASRADDLFRCFPTAFSGSFF